MNRIQRYLCSIAWRILWRWWPDRVYYAAVKGSQPGNSKLRSGSTLIVEAGTPSHPNTHLIETAFLVWEKIDHPGRMVKQRG